MSHDDVTYSGISHAEEAEVERNFQLALQRIDRAKSQGRHEEIAVYGEWPRHGRMVGKVGDRIKAAGYCVTLQADDDGSSDDDACACGVPDGRPAAMRGLVWVTARWVL